MSFLDLTSSNSSTRLTSEDTQEGRWRWFWLACHVMCLPMLVPYLIGMWGFEHYQYFPFVFLVVAYLVYTRWDRSFRAPRGWVGWSLIGAGALAAVTALAFASAILSGVAFVLIATACLHSLKGEDDRSLIAVAVPLLLLIQLPFNLDRLLILRLQNVTTELASVVLDIVAVPHAVSGNVLQLPSKELFVAEACSGIQSVFTLAFLSCVLVAWNRRRIWLTPIYLLIAVVLAIAGNVFRVTTIAFAQAWWGTDLASGWQHEFVGYLALGFAVLFLLSFDQLIVILLHPASSGEGEMLHNPVLRTWNYLVANWRITDEETGYGYRPQRSDADQNTTEESPLERFILGRTSWFVVLGGVGLLTLGALFRSTQVEVNRDPQAIVRSTVLFDPAPDLLQGNYRVLRVGEHQVTRDGSEPRLGQNADLWDCMVGPHQGQLVLSQTYSGWHELCVCYENMEWDLVDRDVCVLPNSLEGIDGVETDEVESFVTARFKSSDAHYGYLLFTAVNRDGTIPEAPGSLGALGARFFSRLERHGVLEQQDLAMLQLWVVTPGKMDADLLNSLQKDFVDVRTRVAKAITTNPSLQTSVQRRASPTNELRLVSTDQ